MSSRFNLALGIALLGACSDPATTVVMTTTDEAPAYGDTPFPTDALREGDRLAPLRGLDKLVVRHHEIVAEQLAALDGFGVRQLVEFFVTAPLDEDSIPAQTSALADAAVVIDVDPSSPERSAAR